MRGNGAATLERTLEGSRSTGQSAIARDLRRGPSRPPVSSFLPFRNEAIILDIVATATEFENCVHAPGLDGKYVGKQVIGPGPLQLTANETVLDYGNWDC